MNIAAWQQKRHRHDSSSGATGKEHADKESNAGFVIIPP